MKKLLTLLAVGSIAFGVVSAAAASLGSVTGGTNLGASTMATTSCDTDGFTATYTTAYSPDSGTYQTTGFTLAGITGCDGKNLKWTLYGGATSSDKTELTSGTTSATDGSVVFLAPEEASQINGLAFLTP